MADKVCALLGCGPGPWVYTGNMREPRFKVSGAISGMLEFESTDSPHGPAPKIRETKIEIGETEATLPSAQFTRVSYKGSSDKLIVHLLSR